MADRLERLYVALRGSQRAVEGTERAVFRTEIGVVHVAVDLVGDDVSRMKPFADGVRLKADANQVVRAKHVPGLGLSQAHRPYSKPPHSQCVVDSGANLGSR